MRLLSSLVGAAVVAVAAVLLTLFALENTQVVSLSFLGSHFSGNIWWLVLGAAALGFLLALVLVIPGRMATSYRASNLVQANARHEQDLADLRDAHTQLQAERDRMATEHARVGNELQTLRDELHVARSDRDAARQEREQLRSERDQSRDQLQSELSQLRDERERLVAERDQLRERLAASPAVAPVTADGYRATVEPALMGAATPTMAHEVADQGDMGQDMGREDQVVSSRSAQEPEMPAAQPAPVATDSEDQVIAREPAVTQPARPSLGERLRAMVTGQPVDEVQAQDEHADELSADTQSDEPVMPANEPVEAQPAQDHEMTGETAAESLDAAAEPANDAETAGPMRADTSQPETAEQLSAETPQSAAPTEGETPVADTSEEPNVTADAAQAQAQAQAQDEVQAQQEHPTLGERLRSLFSEPQPEETPPEQPAESAERPTV